MVRKFVGATLIAGLAATTIFAQASFAQDIKIGYNADQSGTGAAELGVAARYGFEIAIEDINKAGGVLGRKLVGVVRDDLGQPPKSIQNTTELISNEKVVALVGPTNSGNALAWMHTIQQKKIPVIVPVAAGTDLTTRYSTAPQNYTFRVGMVDREQVAMLVAYAVKATEDKKIAFIADSTSFGQGGTKDLTEVLALHGMEPVAVEKFNPKDTDMTSQLTKIRNAGADVVITYSMPDGSAQLLRSMEKLNYFPKVLGSWGNMSHPLPNIAGAKLAERIVFTASATEDMSPLAKDVGVRVREKFPRMATFAAAAQGYDSVIILAAAIQQAGSTDGEKVQQALENLQSPVVGIVKTYEKPFSKENHEALGVADFHLAQWKNGEVISYQDAITKALTKDDYKK